MENRFGYQSLFRNLTSKAVSSSENYGATDQQSPVLDQSLEAALSGLTLSSSTSHHPPLLRRGFDGGESVFDYSTGGGGGGEGSLPLSFETHANLQRLRVRNAVNGQVVFSGTHRWEAFPSGSYPTAAIEPWEREDGVNSSCGFNQNPGGSFLQRKKQLGNQRVSQFPIAPCSNGSRFTVDSDQHFDGLTDVYASDKSVFRDHLCSRRFHQLPQYSNHSSLEDLQGQIVSLAKDQYGSRLLQKIFDDPKEEEIEMFLSEVIHHIDELMRDQFGNYIIQKLVKVCNEKQRTLIIFKMARSPFQLIGACLNPHGTRAVQRLLEHITSRHQISTVMAALRPGFVALATDPNGHHVIQHCLIHFSNEDNKYILSEMVNSCFEVAINKYGCCVLQSCVEHFQGEYRECLVTEIIANALHLAEDPYGNYVVQHLLEQKIPEATENLLRQLEGRYVSLSRNKYSSNVVEKCLTESGDEQSSRILRELLKSPNIPMLLVDPFGNFVIQSALSVSKGLMRNALLNLIRVNAPSMRTNLYGKKVLAKLQHL